MGCDVLQHMLSHAYISETGSSVGWLKVTTKENLEKIVVKVVTVT